MNSVAVMNIGPWRIGRMSFGQMKPLWFFFIVAVDIGFGVHQKKLLSEAVSARDGRVILNSCFRVAFPMIRKGLIIFGSQRQLQKGRRLIKR